MRKESDKILIVGGDRRFDAAEDVLKSKGYSVSRITDEKGAEKELNEADVLLLPLPYTADGVTVYQPDGKGPIPLSAVLRSLRPGKTVLCGKADAELRSAAEKNGAVLLDYNAEEDFAVKNAVPTAEGAIAIALDMLPVTLNGSRVLILGFGRIGRLLAAYLRGFGAAVTVAARKPSDLAFAEAYGYEGVPFSRLAEAVKEKEAIFNTVPAPVLTQEVLTGVSRDAVLIDLASKPGGIDRQAASVLGLNAVRALSLPGKTAPVSAGRYVAETVMRFLSGTEGDG
ncbi:MAG: NAD(P)-binding domain-containing protein [Lachnospiraceae bacterium]|nr:NAD(P)-binding domain-containing protein [Lachnospiraceae bacterium]